MWYSDFLSQQQNKTFDQWRADKSYLQFHDHVSETLILAAAHKTAHVVFAYRTQGHMGW